MLALGGLRHSLTTAHRTIIHVGHVHAHKTQVNLWPLLGCMGTKSRSQTRTGMGTTVGLGLRWRSLKFFYPDATSGRVSQQGVLSYVQYSQGWPGSWPCILKSLCILPYISGSRTKSSRAFLQCSQSAIMIVQNFDWRPRPGLAYVNASSRNGTLGTHPSLHSPKWESLEKVFQKVWNITFLKHFSYFFNKGVQVIILFYAFWAIPTFRLLLRFSGVTHACRKKRNLPPTTYTHTKTQAFAACNFQCLIGTTFNR